MKELTTYTELNNWLYDKTRIGFISNNEYSSYLDDVCTIELYCDTDDNNYLLFTLQDDTTLICKFE